MDIFKIVGIALIAAIFGILLRTQKPEIAAQIPIIVFIIIIISVAPYFGQIIKVFEEICENLKIDPFYVKIVFKMIGVSYIAEFGAKICEDAGEHSIAEAVRIAAKVILLSLSLPIIISLLRIVKNLIYL